MLHLSLLCHIRTHTRTHAHTYVHTSSPSHSTTHTHTHARVQIVREELCSMQLPYLHKAVARGSPKRQEVQDKYGKFQVCGSVCGAGRPHTLRACVWENRGETGNVGHGHSPAMPSSPWRAGVAAH